MSVALPRRPYFLRAMHEWISDAALNPRIIVDTRVEGVCVPAGYADERGRIVLNIGAEAVRGLMLANEAVSFSARFGGVAYSVYVPMAAVLGIYARESGEGIAFAEEDEYGNESVPEPSQSDAKRADRPKLEIVK